MPHNIAHRKLGRVTEHRIALLRNQATALLRHERIETTLPKAKELRPFVERSSPSRSAALPPARPTGARCTRVGSSRSDVHDRDVVDQAVRLAGAAVRGAARRLHAHPAARLPPRRQRRVAQIELVGSEFDPNAEVREERRRSRPSRRKALATGSRPLPSGSAARRTTTSRRAARRQHEGAKAAARSRRHGRPAARSPHPTRTGRPGARPGTLGALFFNGRPGPERVTPPASGVHCRDADQCCLGPLALFRRSRRLHSRPCSLRPRALTASHNIGRLRRFR